MRLDAEQVRLVQETLPLLENTLADASARFYVNLFAIRPEMRALFRDDLESQGMRFLTAMRAIAEGLDDPDGLEARFAGLARGHASVGVRAQHFEPMGDALMVTLGETLGAAFTEERRAAWRAAYTVVADEMIRRGGFR